MLLSRLRRSMRERLLQVVDDVAAAHRREHETGLTAGIECVLKAVEQVEFRSRRDVWAGDDREAAASSARLFVR
jgi:hypothetical protein